MSLHSFILVYIAFPITSPMVSAASRIISRRGVGIGAECEPCRVVAQGAGQGLHIHPILQRQRCEGMPEIMEPDMLGTDRLEDLLVCVPGRSPGRNIPPVLGDGNHVGISRMLLVLLHQQVHRLL